MSNIPLKSIRFPGLDDTYTIPQIDNTLTQAGAAADAKKTGDEISDLKADFNDTIDTSKNLYNKNTDTLGKAINSSGQLVDNTGYRASDYIEIPENGLAIPFIDQTSTIIGRFYTCSYYTANKTFIGRRDTKLSDTSGVYVATRNTFTSPALYVRLCRRWDSGAAQYDTNVMVNAGGILLEYEPYHLPRLKDTAQSASFYSLTGRVENLFDHAFTRSIIKPVGSNYVENTTYTFEIGHAYVVKNTSDHAGVGISIYTRLTIDGENVERVCDNLQAGRSIIYEPSSNTDYIRIVAGSTTSPDTGSLLIYDATSNKRLYDDINTITSESITQDNLYAGAFIFGDGINLSYKVTNIPALTMPADKLDYFYDLFDDLSETYPGYITKVNCDTDAGIDQPVYMEDYPIYLYKFVPPYTPNASGGNPYTAQAGKIIKCMIVGGTHPEYTAIDDLYHTMRIICEEWKNDANINELRWFAEYYVFPCQGSYCVQNNSRTNYNGVDLNRNMPTKNWSESGQGTSTYTGPSAGSEYESQILMHYIDTLKPDIFIDHHNSSLADAESLMYITSSYQSAVDIGANHIATMSHRWQKDYPTNFGNFLSDVYGFAQIQVENGTRSKYACEQGIFGFTFESQQYLCYLGGEFDDTNPEHYTTMVETLATDGFLNFLLKLFKVYSRLSIKKIV